MVNVLTDVIQVIVLSPSTDALLAVHSPFPLGHITGGVNGADKDGFELAHACIGEQEGGVVQGNGGGGVNILVAFLRERGFMAYNVSIPKQQTHYTIESFRGVPVFVVVRTFHAVLTLLAMNGCWLGKGQYHDACTKCNKLNGQKVDQKCMVASRQAE